MSLEAASRRPNIGAFVRKRRASWERLHALAGRVDAGTLSLAEVEELDRLYRRTAGDLAHARAVFPGSDAEGYLSQVTASVYAALYRRRRVRPGAARDFVARRIPETFLAHLPLFGLAAAFLAAGLAAGALAVAFDPAAADSLVPRAVRDAVAAGRMWTDSLLGVAPGVEGSLIAHNNIAVTGLVFALGLTGGIGTGWLLFANGLLLGAVAVHCVQRGLGGPFFSFVAAHAPAELLCVLIAGQAGFLLASALVAPGEWPRGEALVRRGREAARLLALVVPLLAVVGVVESAVSPGATFPAPWKAAFGALLAAVVVLYLVRPAARGRAEA